MKAKYPLYLLLSGLLAVVLSAGCTKAKSDAQIASDVTSKITTDNLVQSRNFKVDTASGVVTLSGTVANEVERDSAARDASMVDGVKTVVNNLQIAPQNAQVQQPETPAPAPEPQTPAPARHKSTAAKSSGLRRSSQPATYSDNSGPDVATNTPPPQPAAPVVPPPPAKVTIPSGTVISIRLNDGLDSATATPGQMFHGSLASPIMIEDNVVVPQNADVEGRVADQKSAGRFAGGSNLALELTNLVVNGKTYPLHTNVWAKQGTGRGKQTAAKVGGGAALGAIIGGLAGGGKGAAIGATVGAGAGTGVSAVGKGQQIKLPPESILEFTLQNPITVTAASTLDRNAGRQPLNQ